MSDIPNIQRLLDKWGAWARDVDSQKIKPLQMFSDGTGKGDMGKLSDDEGLFIDPCVRALMDYDEEAHAIVMLKYVGRAPIRKIAEKLNLPKYVVCNQLLKGETFVLGFWLARKIAKDLRD